MYVAKHFGCVFSGGQEPEYIGCFTTHSLSVGILTSYYGMTLEVCSGLCKQDGLVFFKL